MQNYYFLIEKNHNNGFYLVFFDLLTPYIREVIWGLDQLLSISSQTIHSELRTYHKWFRLSLGLKGGKLGWQHKLLLDSKKSQHEPKIIKTVSIPSNEW